MKRTPIGAHRPVKDVRLAKVDPKLAERSICNGYVHSKH
jgi:hypothetical protein